MRQLAGRSTMPFARINGWHLLASGVHIPVYLSNHQLLSIGIFINLMYMNIVHDNLNVFH